MVNDRETYTLGLGGKDGTKLVFNAQSTMMVVSRSRTLTERRTGQSYARRRKEGMINDGYIPQKCMKEQDPQKPCGQQERGVHIWNVHSRNNKCTCVRVCVHVCVCG